MPKLKESEAELINKRWRALVARQCELENIYTQDELAKKLKISRKTVGLRMKTVFGMKVTDLIKMCACLRIDAEDLNKVFGGN